MVDLARPGALPAAALEVVLGRRGGGEQLADSLDLRGLGVWEADAIADEPVVEVGPGAHELSAWSGFADERKNVTSPGSPADWTRSPSRTAPLDPVEGLDCSAPAGPRGGSATARA